MGILDKVRNLFTEEVEEVEEKPVIRKENRNIETVIPKRETPSFREESISSIPRVEEPKEKVIFPVYFDDKDFDDLEKPKQKEIKKEEPKKEKSEPYKGAKVNATPEPKKVFKPSPIISPVYGILDKNYTKDDIVTKTEMARHNNHSTYKKEHMTIDDIRNKAYGTLEDEIDDTLLGTVDIPKVNPQNAIDNQEALDIFNELDFDKMDIPNPSSSLDELEKKVLIESNDLDDDTEELARQLEDQKKKLEEINQYMSENEVVSDKEEFNSTDSELEKDLLDDEFIEESIADDKIEKEIGPLEEKKDNDTNLDDSELFDLIDSMYEKRDEE